MLSYLARASCSRPALRALPRQPILAHRPSLVLPPASPFLRSLRTSSVLRDVPAHPLDTSDDRPRLTSQVIPPASAPAAAPTSLIERWTPAWASAAKPYLHLMRLDKPAGTLLLYWPCAWSITIASTVNHLPPAVPAFYCGLFALGAFIMRGAGCTINDMWDRKFDAAVERTKTRPLAAGDITPFRALVFLGGQLSAGLAVLTQLNWYSIVLGASSMGIVVMYPFMKRVTYYPQVFMGLAFSWGTMLGWSAVAGAVDWTITVPMLLGTTAWGMMYDTIYAHQDKKDDALVGVKSIALAHPSLTTSRAIISSLSAFFVSTLALTGELAGLGPLYYLISCGGASAHLAWQCWTVDFDNGADLWKKFKSNGWLGGLIAVGCWADYLVQVVLPGHLGFNKLKASLADELN